MKKFILLVIALAIFTNTSFAQDTVRTLIHPTKIRNYGLYFAPEFQYGQSNATLNSFSGGSAMFIFNKRLALGVAAFESLNETFSPKGVTPLVLRTAFGGGKLEYTLRPDAAFHVSFPLLIGAGAARMDSVSTTTTINEHYRGLSSRNALFNAEYFVVQPGINVETNLLKNIKMFVGVNYRFTSKLGTATTSVPTDALSGFGMSAGVKIGIFDVKKPHFKVPKIKH
jgi:hypothetical protein